MLRFYGKELYDHITLRLNYTTYNVRRAQDTVNVSNSHSNIMVYSPEGGNKSHLYWYARVIGIFHAKVYYPKCAHGTRFNFLWVRWFAHDTSIASGWDASCMDCVKFVPQSPDADINDGAFGFIDPQDVVRACHLIPCWNAGRTTSYLGQSAFRDPDGDFRYYWVNR